MGETGPIQSRKDFPNTPQGLQQYWGIEIQAALKNREEFLRQGEEAVKRFLDDRADSDGPRSRLNLYHANVTTLRAMLYGKMPSVDVGRRFNDSQDDVARVAAEMQERILNTDIEMDDDGFSSALRYALEDWTGPGLGQMWCRYETGEEKTEPARPAKLAADGTELAPEVPEVVTRPDEDVEVDYIHWRDFLWGPCRNWHENRWVAKRVEMTRDQAVERFGEIAKDIQLRNRQPASKEDGGKLAEDVKDAWSRAEVWEIWCKETEHQYFYSEGMDRILKQQPDPLGLENFFPCPRPLLANASTGKLMPKPDFALAKDLYDEIDNLTARIKRLEDCCKVRWAYDGSVPDLERLFDEAFEGQGIPVKNWNALKEKGGLGAALEFAPLDMIVKGIEVLTVKRQEKIQLLYQITGMSDIVRGQAAQRATATEQSIKAQFASTRIQTQQDELARFASDAQRIRAEIISKHFDPQTIVLRSNTMNTPDADKAQAAVELIKSDFWRFRISVRPESIALPDMATQRQERAEAVQALGSYFQSMMPLVQLGASQPGALAAVMGFVIKTGQWMVSGLRGASEVEEAFDRFAEQVQQIASQPPPPPPPDPALEAKKFEAGAKMEQTKMDMQVAQAEHGMKMQQMQAEMVQDRAKTQNEMARAAVRPPLVAPGGPNA